MDVVAQHRKALTAAILAVIGLGNAYLGINITLPAWIVDAGHLFGVDLTLSGIVNIVVLMIIPAAVHQVPNAPSPVMIKQAEAIVIDKAGGNPGGGG